MTASTVAAQLSVTSTVTPDIIHKDDQYCLARLGNMVAVIWNKPPTGAAIDEVNAAMRSTAKEQGRVAMFIVVRSKGSPSNDANKKTVAGLKEFNDALIGICSVAGGADFWSKLSRVAMHSIAALATFNKTKFNFVATVPEGLDWLFQQGGISMSKAEMTAGVQALVDSYPAL